MNKLKPDESNTFTKYAATNIQHLTDIHHFLNAEHSHACTSFPKFNQVKLLRKCRACQSDEIIMNTKLSLDENWHHLIKKVNACMQLLRREKSFCAFQEKMVHLWIVCVGLWLQSFSSYYFWLVKMFKQVGGVTPYLSWGWVGLFPKLSWLNSTLRT